MRAAFDACLGLGLLDGDVTVRALPQRQLVPPPDLTRDVPVRGLLERRDREAMLRLGVEPDPARAERLERGLLELVHRAPPLHRDPRLDTGLASVAESHRMAVRLTLLELIALAQPGKDSFVSLGLGQAGELTGLVAHATVSRDHRQLLEAVINAELVVERVVTRRDLERAGRELLLDALVGDHGHPTLDEGHDDLTADQLPVALVVGMHRHGDVREDRRRANGGDRDVSVAIGERIANVGQRVVDVFVRELEVRERRLVEGAPVDDPIGTVDPPLPVQVDEEPHHGSDVRVVHGEALAPVVERRADAPELEHDLAAVLAEPLPYPLFEGLAAEVLTGLPFRGEVLLDRVLRRDAGVVEPGLEEHVEALHAPHPDQRVGEGQLQRMPHVQVSGDVGRRVRDREARPPRIRIRVVEPLGLPCLLPAAFHPLGRVERIHGREVYGAGVGPKSDTRGRGAVSDLSRTPALRARGWSRSRARGASLPRPRAGPR